MNILVTGGAGFIASHIVDAYIRKGHRVVIVDNLSTGCMDNVHPDAEFVKMDIRDAGIADLFEKHRFDVVNHHAAQMDVRKSVEDPIYDANCNVIGFINILQNCAKYQVGKVLFASSGGAVYGEQESFPADEQHKTQPYSPYGITKLIGEKYLFFYSLTYNIRYIAFRYANVYGPRQNPHGEAGVVAIFAQKLLAGESPTINGSGEQTRDFVYVHDLVRANVMALDYDLDAIFNVGTGQETTINKIFRLLSELTGGKGEERHAPAKPGEQFRSVVDSSLIWREMGWKPDVDTRQGLAETVDFFKGKYGRA
ncbi:UDP-glucose 4-epimerase [candidate division KSB1 bacterium RBG_16_48_16]|nr:MAG: UDP-glucose 4-epimerase [candidate division KSB1 bacterium RBG_16_48_16]